MKSNLDYQEINWEINPEEATLDVARKAAHDIRSPLSALKMLERHSDWNQADIRHLIKIAVGRISDITNDLLKHNSDRGIQGQSRASCFEVNQAVSHIMNEKQVQFSTAEVCLIFIPLNTQVWVAGDQSFLQRALSNFINNAVDAKKNQCVNITLSIEKQDGKIAVKVSDDGVGMSELVLKKLGRECFSEGHSKQLTGSGFGLGVQGSVEMLKKLNAETVYDSILGQGTTVSIFLPEIKEPYSLVHD